MAIFTAIGMGIAAAAGALGASAAVVAAISASAFAVGVAATALVVAVSYQAYTASKMRKAAREAAEARKGFELVIDGGIQTLPLVYGRALVGGTRVFHNTSSSFQYAANSANRTFNLGSRYVAAFSRIFNRETEQGIVEDTENVAERPAGTLVQTINGEKNEFLFFQQALCLGPINSVYDVVIDESQFLDDPSLGESESNYIFKSGAYVEDNDQKAALRLDYFYNGGADSLMAKNFSERGSAAFPEIAYLSAYVRLDRDQPQFSRVPAIQTFLEGRTIRKITRTGSSPNYSYSLNTTREYSNNPAYCLLDYLLDTRVGKGLSTDQIDLEHFYNAAQVCDTNVQPGSPVYVGGKIWQPTTNTRTPVTQRQLPLYECNIILDTSKPVRENVEKLLTTMGDARLVWSQGKYKLLLQYPLSNAQILVAATLTDDDIAHDKPVEVAWPGNGSRFNSATVKFNNESQNFKEDSVSWPPKENRQNKRGVGVKKYLPVSGWDTVKTGGVFLNNYAVWNGNTTSTSMQWKIIAAETGTHNLKFTADNYITVTIAGSTFTHDNWETIDTGTVSLTANVEYTISVTASDDGGPRGAAAQLISPSGVTLWTTRDDSYSAYINFAVTNTLYQQFLTEDNNVKLETEVFADGVTDYYHALAKAEELVRVSRTAAVIKFEYIVKNKYLEPGDIIKINSETLKLGNTSDLYLKIDEVKLQEGAICEITGTRFDYTQLAWNVKDSEFIKIPNLYNAYITAPYYLSYTPGTLVGGTENNPNFFSPGTLNWGLSPDPDITEYILYFHKFGELDSNGHQAFKEIGRASAPPFNIPGLTSVPGIFGVKAVTTRGMSGMTVSSTDTTVTLIDNKLKPLATASLAIVSFGQYNESCKLSWVLPLTTIDTNTIYNDHSHVKIFRAKVIAPTVQVPNPVLTFVEIGTSNTLEFIDTPTEYGDLAYKIKFVSLRGLESDFSNQVQISVAYWERFIDNTIPPDPTNLQLTEYYSGLNLTWTIPTYTTGGGHGSSNIYYKEWPLNTTQPTFAESVKIANITGNGSSYFFSGEPSTRYIFWVKEVSKGLAESTGFAGPANGTTGVNVEKVLDTLTAQINEEYLSSNLNARLDQIDYPGTGLITQVQNLTTVYGDVTSAAASAATAVNSAAQATTAAGNALIAQANAALSSTNAANASSAALQAQLDAIQARINAQLAEANALQAQLLAIQAKVTAETAATNAQADRIIAAGAAVSASESSSLAATSQVNAGNSASAAAFSASGASTSASNAAGSASVAEAQAALASSKALESNSSAQASALSASGSSSSAISAGLSSAAADASASLASSKATLANDAASAAALSASGASVSQVTATDASASATGSASIAVSQAALAASSANSAAFSASGASSSESNASLASANASGSAAVASSAATLASDKASAAAFSADGASTSKVTATDAAASAVGSASLATTQATLAGNSASAAALSATGASTSESNAASSSASASGSASLATSQANFADNRANAAALSATGASTSESNAALSASSALGSASLASSQASFADSRANAAALSATGASNSEATATQAASNAAVSASFADSQATLAGNSANAAALSASGASSSEVTATSSASAAQASASLASSQASLAYDKASAAALSASGASESKVTATDAASSASANASLASSQASLASNSASAAALSASGASSSQVTATDAASSAQASASLADSQATFASNSASAAALSASGASTSAADANTAASTATGQASIATTQANTASNAASAAALSAIGASQSASDALGAVSTATGQAAIATTQANTATNAANAAAFSAGGAATSAANAAGSASDATGTLTLATSQATAAAQSANQAANSASAAAISASGASNSVVTADSAASSASINQLLAAASASQAATSAQAAQTAQSASEVYANQAGTFALNASQSQTLAATNASDALSYSASAVSAATDAQGYATSAATALTGVRATATGFYSAAAWDFTSNTEGWTAASATITYNSGGTITLAGSSADPQFISPLLAITGKYSYIVRARIKRLAGTGWQGDVYYRTATDSDGATGGYHDFLETYKKTISNTTVLNEWRVLEWDMSALTAGAADWTTKQITKIRIDLGTTAADQFEIDWIAIGTVKPENAFVGAVNIADTSWWSTSLTTSSPWPDGWTRNGANAETIFELGSDHISKSTVLMKCVSTAGGGSAGGPDGGFNADLTGIDRTKTYRFIIPVKRTTNDIGTNYWGVYGACTLNGTTLNANPHFMYKRLPKKDVWYFMIGYVFPYGSTGNSHTNSGLYEVATGDLIELGSNFTWHDTAVAQYRAYQYYSDQVGVTSYFAKPMIHLVDGSEPPVSVLMTSARSNYAGVQTKMSVKTESDGSSTAEYALLVDANGNVAGFETLSSVDAAGNTSSSFGVRADKFFIGPSGAIADKAPFVVLAAADANGNPAGVYIADAFIKNASITLAKIDTANITNLSAIKTTTGTLTINDNGYIKTEGNTGYDTNGIFLGKDGATTKFSLGTGTNKLTFDGTTLTIPAVNISGAIPTNSIPAGYANSDVSLNSLGYKIYRIIAAGSSASGLPANAGLYLNGASVSGAARSYIMHRIKRADGTVEFTQTYDVYGDGANSSGRNAATLATDLNATDSTYIVVVRTFDEPQTNRTAALLTAMYRCGASRTIFNSSKFKFRAAYALVGIGGCGEGNGAEFYQGAIDNDPNAWIDATFAVANGNLTGVSGSYKPTSIEDYGYTGNQIDNSKLTTSNLNSGISGANESYTGTAKIQIDAPSNGGRIIIRDASNAIRVKIGFLG